MKEMLIRIIRDPTGKRQPARVRAQRSNKLPSHPKSGQPKSY